MHKIPYQLFDKFIPNELYDQLDSPMRFRVRSSVQAGLLGMLVVSLLFLGSWYFRAAPLTLIGVAISFIVFFGQTFSFKFLTTRIDEFLKLGSYLQVSILLILIYVTSFSAGGLGFFGIIWIIPLFLISAFYFEIKLTALFLVINLLTLVTIYYYQGSRFYLPIGSSPFFKELFLLNLILAFILSSLLVYFYIFLNELHKKELSSDKMNFGEIVKYRSLIEMTSGLAHEVNNPLFTIQGRLHHIRNLLLQGELDLNKCDQVIDDVENTIFRLSQIMKGVSTFARQGNGHQMISLGVNEIVNSSVFFVTDRIVQSGITLDVKIDSNVKVICYPSYISRVIINLINIAISNLELSELSLIEIEAFDNNDWVEIHIKDSGPVLDPKIQESMISFDPLNHPSDKSIKVGLHLSMGLLIEHEGELNYQRLGNMNDFCIKLPSYN